MIFLFLLLLAGCADESLFTSVRSLTNFESVKVWLKKVKFDIKDNMNHSAPVIFHVVIAYDKEVFGKLREMTALDYFGKKGKQFVRDHKDSLEVILDIDIVPGVSLKEKKIKPKKVSGVGVLAFANYNTPGAHRIVFDSEEEVEISFKKNTFFLKGEKSSFENLF